MTNLNLQTRQRILLVDDETELRARIGLELAEAGYEVGHAGNGRDAITLHREKPFNLVIAELQLADRYDEASPIRITGRVDELIALLGRI